MKNANQSLERPIGCNQSTIVHAWKFVFIAMIIIMASGCTRSRYTANNLPQNFLAPRHISAKHIDLTSINRNTRPSEWLEPGDQVEVMVATGIETNEAPSWELTINPKGEIDVPLVGLTPVAGIDANQAAERIRYDAIRRGLYVDPKVTVSL